VLSNAKFNKAEQERILSSPDRLNIIRAVFSKRTRPICCIRQRSYEIATKIAYRNGGLIGIPKGGAMDCTMVATAPVFPVGYLVSASRIADKRMILAGYRLAGGSAVSVAL
jgi:hypothetical protein